LLLYKLSSTNCTCSFCFLSIIYQNVDYTSNKEECPMESLKQHLTKEGEEILEVIEEIKLKLEDARKKFDQATDDTLIDCYIYELNALYKKYEYFLKMAKEIGLIAMGYEKISWCILIEKIKCFYVLICF